MKKSTDCNMKSTILNTAIDLFRRDGMANVTIQQICGACHVTKGCFYHYYPSKESVLLDFYSSAHLDFGRATASIIQYNTFSDKLWNFYRYYVEESIHMGPELLCQLIRTDMEAGSLHFTCDYRVPSEETESFCRIAEELTHLGQEAGEFCRELPPRELRMMYTAAFIGVLTDWCGGGGRFDPIKRLEKIFLRLYRM